MVVYKITNIINNKVYIGKTISFEKRKKEHLYALKRGNHENIHLQNSYNTYGFDAFTFTIIDFASSEEEVLELEKQWIKKYSKEQRYNICEFPGSTKGRPVSEETRKKQSIAMSGKKHTNETKQKVSIYRKNRKDSDLSILNKRASATKLRGKPISMFTLDGNFVQTFVSANEAARFFNKKSAGNISTAVYKNSVCYGYKWKYT